MTVVIGMLCDGGVVIGSDSSATSYAVQIPVIEQPTKKVFVVGEDMICAGTGSVGLGQRFASILRQVRTKPEFGQLGVDHLAIAKFICGTAINDFQQTFCKPGGFGALVAFSCHDDVYLCEFAIADFQPEFKMDDIWFVSMGSGQAIADPFLGMLRRAFFRASRPKLNEGIFAVTWALQQAIELNTGGINGPEQVAVLARYG